jgi:hypothetical protein
MRTIECNCDKNFEADIPECFDLDKEPELLQEIVSGRFLTFTCPHCQTTIKPELPFEIIQKSKKLHLHFIPELDRIKVREGEINIKTAATAEEQTRLVIGYQELVEKLNIFGLAIDDRALEILKYHILTKAMQQVTDEPEDDQTTVTAADADTTATAGSEAPGQEPQAEPIYIYFKEQVDRQLVFHIHNLKPGNIAIFKLGVDVYEKSLKNLEQTLKKDPFNRILKPPYVSINNLYMEK